MSENSQDYAQKPQQNRTFMNSASVQGLRRCVVKEASDVPSKDLKGLGKTTQSTL
jgi:hypothetical protein